MYGRRCWAIAICSESDYLNLLAELEWRPAIVSLQSATGVNRFAFVIHPLSPRYIFNHPALRRLRWLPESLGGVPSSAYAPPLRVSRITGIRSPATGQVVEGDLYSLGATPRQMMKRDPSFTYRRLEQIAREAPGAGRPHRRPGRLHQRRRRRRRDRGAQRRHPHHERQQPDGGRHAGDRQTGRDQAGRDRLDAGQRHGDRGHRLHRIRLFAACWRRRWAASRWWRPVQNG